ncbi:uncharacterized protein NPIL_260021 [Nephila pilipes]|uniref:Uncharacterized protein n=1 Tax=Nephila pilipes TaxID=299642 RepID=A0A8X6IYB9_NEPPI|nr:uncharacterized protein NPIL_260021 [Nephila pilipes]
MLFDHVLSNPHDTVFAVNPSQLNSNWFPYNSKKIESRNQRRRKCFRSFCTFKMKTEFLDTTEKRLILGLICFITFLTLGSSRLSGLLFVACMARYETGRKQASLPFILCYTVRNISGPFIGYLGNRFGLVTVTVIGCIFATVGVGACFFAEDILAVIFLWGVVYGLGFGMGTCLLPQILSQHFEKHMDKANGVYSGGGCIGSFILPVIVDKLIVEYGTSGMFLIFSGLIMNSVPAALLLRKSDKSATECKQNHTYEGKTVSKKEKSAKSSEHQEGMPSEIFRTSEFQNASVFYIDIQQKNEKMANRCSEEYKYSKQLNSSSNESEKDAKITFTEIKITAENRNSNLPVVLQDSVQSKPCKENSEFSDDNLFSKYSEKLRPSTSISNKECSSSNSFQVFLDLSFILILLTQGLMLNVIVTVWTVIIDASKDKGISEREGVHILICMGVTDMIGRFSLGYITDGGYMTKISFQILCIVGLGVFHIFFTFLKGFIMVLISVGVFGIFTAGHVMIGTGIIYQVTEKEYLTMALASRYFAFPFLSFAQAPIIGN